jgi:hypothetical protein
MNGLLWMDDKGEVADRIKRADARHCRKYGKAPNICHVNPAELAEEVEIGGVTAKPVRGTLLYHYLIGVETMENKPTPPQAAEDLSQETCNLCDLVDVCDQTECLLDLAEKAADYRDERQQAYRPF